MRIYRLNGIWAHMPDTEQQTERKDNKKKKKERKEPKARQVQNGPCLAVDQCVDWWAYFDQLNTSVIIVC